MVQKNWVRTSGPVPTRHATDSAWFRRHRTRGPDGTIVGPRDKSILTLVPGTDLTPGSGEIWHIAPWSAQWVQLVQTRRFSSVVTFEQRNFDGSSTQQITTQQLPAPRCRTNKHITWRVECQRNYSISNIPSVRARAHVFVEYSYVSCE